MGATIPKFCHSFLDSLLTQSKAQGAWMIPELGPAQPPQVGVIAGWRHGPKNPLGTCASIIPPTRVPLANQGILNVVMLRLLLLFAKAALRLVHDALL